MKKLNKKLIIIGSLVLLIVVSWLCQKPEIIHADYDSLTLRHIYGTTSDWYILDGAGASTSITFPIKTSRGFGVHWGDACVYVEAETLKADVSNQDSIQIWYQEQMDTDGNVSYYDSTQVTSRFNWDHGQWKKYTLTPDPNFGYDFEVKHNTAKDDCVRVRLRLIYQ